MRQVNVWRRGICFGCVVGVLSISLASLAGCRETEQEEIGREPHTPQANFIGSIGPSASTELQTLAQPEARGEQGVAYVFAGQDLGMTLTGSGAAGRSVADLEQHIAAFLPQIQELYVRELAHDASLMGSIDVKLAIEPNGAVSDLRFPDLRISSEQLKTVVFDQMRGWVFPAAAEQVHLRYRLLFVPPDVDARTILAWETRTKRPRNGKTLRIAAAPALTERSSSETSVEAPAASSQHVSASELASLPSIGEAYPTSSRAAVETSTASTQRASASELASLPGIGERIGKPPPIPELEGRVSVQEAETHEVEPESDTEIGWYRVLDSTVLYDAPNEYADVVAQLRQGMRIQVVDVIEGDIEGEWLEVHSVTDRPPGYLRVQHAVPDATRQADWS